MQTGYIMPRPKGTPRRLLHFPGSGHKANISTWDKIPAANPNPTSGLEATAPDPGGHCSRPHLHPQRPWGLGEPHTSTRGLHWSPPPPPDTPTKHELH